ncbi:EAL domain-containing protein [Thermocrinis sp.]
MEIVSIRDLKFICEVIEKSPDIIFSIDPNGIVKYVNETFTKLLGYEKEEIIGKSIRIVSIDDNIYNTCMMEVKTTGRCLDQETIFRKKDGTIIHVVKNVNAVYDERGNIEYLIINARDLTHLDELNKELSRLSKLYEERFKLVYNIFLNINDAVAVLDKDCQYIEHNKAHEELIGYSIEELKGKSPSVCIDKEKYKEILNTIQQKGSFGGEVKIKDKWGNIKDIYLFAFSVKDEEGKALYYVTIKRDITKEKQLIYKDKLTGLPNRLKLMEDLTGKKDLKLILVDIDSFADINNTYGYGAGDLVLQSLAESLSDLCNKHGLQVYRSGGDEFAIVIDRFFPRRDFEVFLDSVVHSIESKPVEAEGYTIKLDITLGVAEGKNSGDIVKKANMALKHAKQTKKTYVIYSDDINLEKKSRENRFWLDTLKEAIKKDGLVVFYQGIMDNKLLRIDKYESLIRIRMDDKIISPYYFLDVAKKSKLYPIITKKVFAEAVKYAEEHEISINLSIKDIQDEETVSYIMEILKRHRPKLTFEILESEGIENYEEVSSFIESVKEYGCKIAIDDFGSGYSNFAHILRLKVDYLKIDSSLIGNIHVDQNAQVIVETIVGFARKLGIKTIAEFVHSKEVFEKVIELGIDYSQGYYIAEPQPNISMSAFQKT